VKTLILLTALFAPVLAIADEWVPLNVPAYPNYTIDPSSIQQGQRIDSKAPVYGIWIRSLNSEPFQVWIDCGFRQAQTYGFIASGLWSQWHPIPPESMEWAVWQFVCAKERPEKSVGKAPN
jgi:hypothetical protein